MEDELEWNKKPIKKQKNITDYVVSLGLLKNSAIRYFKKVFTSLEVCYLR